MIENVHLFVEKTKYFLSTNLFMIEKGLDTKLSEENQKVRVLYQ